MVFLEDYAASLMARSLSPDPQPARRQQIQKTWERCVIEEKRVLAADHKQLLEEFEDNLTFGPLPLFSGRDNCSDQRMADNYRQLLKMLRAAVSSDDKLRLLAMWLRQTGIAQPREFLPKEVRKRLIEQTLREDDTRDKPDPLIPMTDERRLYLPSVEHPAEFMYAQVAEAWKPYFELMHVELQRTWNDRRRSDTRNKERMLVDLGFDATAVDAGLGSSGGLRTPREGACRFAAGRLDLDEDTVLVAYSGIYPGPATRPRRRKREAAKRKREKEQKQAAKRAAEQAIRPQKSPSSS